MLAFSHRNRQHQIPDVERQPCEVWSRVMGYLRPVTVDGYQTTGWNKGKVSEWNERVFFDPEKKMSQEARLRHIEQTAQTVESWPEWKKNIPIAPERR